MKMNIFIGCIMICQCKMFFLYCEIQVILVSNRHVIDADTVDSWQSVWWAYWHCPYIDEEAGLKYPEKSKYRNFKCKLNYNLRSVNIQHFWSSNISFLILDSFSGLKVADNIVSLILLSSNMQWKRTCRYFCFVWVVCHGLCYIV